jgi:hypothetical protein
MTPGSTVSFCSTVNNNGTSNSGATSIKYYLSSNTSLSSSDILIGTVTLPAINAGANTQICSDITIPANTSTSFTGYVLFVADNENIVCETSESNNIVSKSTKVRSICTAALVGTSDTDTDTYYDTTEQGSEPKMVTTDTESPHQTTTEGTITLRPNPANQYTDIDLQTQQNTAVSIELLNELGQQILSDTWINQNSKKYYRLDLTNIKSGFYNVRITYTDAPPQVVKLAVVH